MWYEEERPAEIRTRSGTARFFAKAGKLQISRPSFYDNAGKEYISKTCTISLESVISAGEAENFIEMLNRVISAVRKLTGEKEPSPLPFDPFDALAPIERGVSCKVLDAMFEMHEKIAAGAAAEEMEEQNEY